MVSWDFCAKCNMLDSVLVSLKVSKQFIRLS